MQIAGGSDASTHLAIAILGWAFGGVFTAGGFYIYVRMSISNLEKWGQANHATLEAKIDKNFETLEKKIDRNETSCKQDLSGIGGKVTHYERQASRRYHNMTAAVLLAAPPDMEKEIGILIKEEAS